MEHTLERYGSESIDARVEPAGLNALHIAIRRGAFKIAQVFLSYSRLVQASLAGTLKRSFRVIVQVLLSHGANANQATTNGSTALLLACRYNDLRMARLIAASGLRPATLTAHDSEQRMTPMLWACLHCNADLVKLLCTTALQLRVSPGVLARTTNRFGQSPIMLAFAACPARVGSSNAEKVRSGVLVVRAYLFAGHACRFACQGLAAAIGSEAALDAAAAVGPSQRIDSGTTHIVDVGSEATDAVDDDDKSRGALAAAVLPSSPISDAVSTQLSHVRAQYAARLRASSSGYSKSVNPPDFLEVRRQEGSTVAVWLYRFPGMTAAEAPRHRQSMHYYYDSTRF